MDHSAGCTNMELYADNLQIKANGAELQRYWSCLPWVCARLTPQSSGLLARLCADLKAHFPHRAETWLAAARFMLHLSEEAPSRDEATSLAERGLDLARKVRGMAADTGSSLIPCLGQGYRWG
jgi:hypothetical protein